MKQFNILIIIVILILGGSVLLLNKKTNTPETTQDSLKKAIDYISDRANRLSLPDSELRTGNSQNWREHGTFDWKTYVDKDFGIEFKYPKVLKIVDTEGKESKTGIYAKQHYFGNSSSTVEYNIAIQQDSEGCNENMAVDDFFGANIFLSYLYNNDVYKPIDNQKMEKINVNGKEFTHLYGLDEATNVTTNSYITRIEPGWALVINPKYGFYKKNEDNIILRAIVNTLKIPDHFTNSTTTPE